MKLKQFIFAFTAMLSCFAVSVNAQVAKVGNTEYATIEAAFAAATEGQTITMLVDATPALTSQRAITKAAVIDLGNKTMTLTEDDLYFGTTTFKNGTIVVDPSVKPSTAVFWMFANQTLTFDNVKIVATGVTGTYLIGLEGENSDLNLLNGSEILVENTTALDLDIICVNGTNTCDIKVENSKVNVSNLDGRVFFRGNYTVKDSEVNLEGITKAGFRIEAGQTLSIEGTSKVNITGEPRDGGIHLTDLTATYTVAETATVTATINEPKVAKVGENTYRTLAEAVAAVEDGGTITLIANETFTENNRYNNGGYWDGLGYSGDKSFTIDLAGFTISQDGSLNDYLLWFKNAGSKKNTITIKNGTLDAGTTAFCALCTASSHENELTINTENLTLINNNSNGSTVKVRAGSVLNVKEGTKITGKNSYLGIENWKATVNIYDGAEIYMNGTSSYNGCLVGVGGNGTVNVYGGKGKGVSGGFIAMTSGGTINVEGGEWIANTDGTYANSNKSVLIAQSDKQYNAGAGNAVVNVTGGTFKGGYNCYGNKAGDAQINIKGGNFNANPTSYVAEGCLVVENNGVWTVERGLAGAGTEAEPYLINNVSDLKFFRDEVNKGVANKYNDPGVWVALGADIDLSGENWVGIGSATADHGFMGNFDGKNFKIKNLTITNPALSDGYAYAGLFGVTEGTDQNNQNTIKNLTIENVTIKTTGAIAAAAIAYPYYTIIDNVKVCGDIAITGGDYTAGVLAYTRRCVNASNLSIVGNEGSFVKGSQTVGGVISDIQMNGRLTAVYNNFSAEGLTISGEKSVGGISGIISGQALDGATVKNVTLSCSDARVGIVSGSLGDTSTISNVTYKNVTGATALIGASYKDAKAVAAKIGDTYYATLEDALAAVLDGETITLVEGVEGDESKTEIEFTKAIEFTITGNAPKYALPVITFQNATVNIKDAEVLIPELDARQNATINVIDSKVVGVGGDDIIKSYYNGAINIEGKSEVYTMQVTTMGYINIKGEAKLNATWQTNVYGNGMITMAEGATFNTAALHLTGKDYSGRDNTDSGRVGMPATIVVDDANFTVGKVLSNNGADYSYNSSKGINIGTVDGKNAVLDIKNGANVNFFMANGQTANIGAGGTVNIDGALSVACRGEGNVTLVNNGAINLTSEGATLKAQEGLNIATTLPGYFVQYADGVYSVCGEIAFVDGEFTEYTNAADMVIKTLTYKRKFSTSWTPFYVPFAVPVSELAEQFDIAYINDVRRTDKDNDGVLDDFRMEIIYIHGGNANGSAKTLKANYPYFIRSKSGETETMEITLTDATLYAAKENIFDCTTMTEKFEIKGNNSKMLSNEFTSSDYIVSKDGWQNIASGSYLNPFRFYMTRSSREGSDPTTMAPLKSMKIVVCGEEDENGATIIYDVVEDSLNNNGNDFIYDLQGRRVSEPKKGGIYIKNGKKILF